MDPDRLASGLFIELTNSCVGGRYIIEQKSWHVCDSQSYSISSHYNICDKTVHFELTSNQANLLLSSKSHTETVV